ncbi:hypothetical protein JF55_11455 [Pseudomonas sp. 1-7]|nr:hypothetical protein JF55_11455 [Pseudomonas sp. 1-7]
MQYDNFLVLKRLVADSDVLSMAPWDVIADEVHSGQLSLLPLLPQNLHQHSYYGLWPGVSCRAQPVASCAGNGRSDQAGG